MQLILYSLSEMLLQQQTKTKQHNLLPDKTVYRELKLLLLSALSYYLHYTVV